MNIFILLLVTVSLVSPVTCFAQESGWADSAGYKQQILPTKSIRQVLYSQSGDTLYSINFDTLYRIHHWDATTGKLLKRQSVDMSGYNLILSVVISIDCRTYSVCGTLTNNTFHVRIYSLRTDSLLYDAALPITKSKECTAMFDSSLRILTVFSTTIDNRINPYGPNGTLDGRVVQFSMVTVKPELIRSQDGAVSKFTLSPSNSQVAWIGYYHNIEYFKLKINSETKWMENFLWNDTLKTNMTVDFEFGGGNSMYDAKYGLSYHPLLTNDGKHYFLVNHQKMMHWSLKPYGYLSYKTLPFIPTLVVVAPTSSHTLLTDGKNILLYHITSDSITDTFSLPFTCTLAAFRAKSNTAVFVSNENNLRVVSMPLTIPSIPTTFRASQTTMYSDSLTTFSIISNKIYERFLWDFGDGITDTNEFVIHAYSKPGMYSVQLIVTDASGASISSIKKNYITILPQLLPAFSATPRNGNVPLAVQFTDESKGSITSWKWDFGNNRTDTSQHPKHTFVDKKYYDVALSVSDGLSTKHLKQPFYINGDTISVDTFSVVKRIVNTTINQPIMNYVGEFYQNTYTHGVLGFQGNLYTYWRECHSTVDIFGASSNTYYHPSQSVLSISKNADSTSTILSYKSIISGDICHDVLQSEGNLFFRKKDSSIYTSFVRMFSGVPGNPDGIFSSKNGFFRPNGWSHNFEYSFLPDGTDIFLFRSKGYSSTLQFFSNQTIPFAFDTLLGDVMRPLISVDSQQITVFCNPYQSKDDSIQWLIQRTYSKDGIFLNEKHILKNITVRLTDIADLGWGEYLVCGSIGNYYGYLAKIGSDGRIAWQYNSSIFVKFNKLQKLGTGNYAVWGTPQAGMNHGYLSFQIDGKILVDNRLVGAMNSFTPSDFVVGEGSKSLWFIGSENVQGQGQRAAVYLCSVPTSAVTTVKENSNSYIPSHFLVDVYPMPTSSGVTVRVASPSACQVKVSLVSIVGVEWPLNEQELISGMNEFHIPTDGLVSGMYSIRLRSNDEVRVIPVIVVR